MEKSFTTNNSFDMSGLKACSNYTLEVTTKYEGKFGKPKAVKFQTFPDETFFDVKMEENGIQYSHSSLSECKSFEHITYRLSVITESGETKEALLKARASFFELDSGLQRFKAEDIFQELTALRILEACKSYKINITALVEGKNRFFHWVL